MAPKTRIAVVASSAIGGLAIGVSSYGRPLPPISAKNNPKKTKAVKDHLISNDSRVYNRQ
jgi:hypothetical protein